VTSTDSQTVKPTAKSSASKPTTSQQVDWLKFIAAPERILAVLLAFEILVFSCLGTNFLTRDNAFEVVRFSVEIGLLALALTPVIVSGGIDLSVGSLMGLSAIVFGKLWRDAGLPIWLAATITIGCGALAGGLNAILITRLKIPPLIVTLGSFSLFRGLAEGLTAAVDNFTDFPAPFLFLGQGYLLWGIPAQLPLFLMVALAFWVLLECSTVGRTLYAIGFSPEGSRHAGIPVSQRIALVYVLSGLASSLAAIIYVAHLGQAKADAGTGYELMAITAVVLGGTSIFGGKGHIHGTLLGLFAIAILQDGLRLSDLPAELAGILAGVLLLATISLDAILSRPKKIEAGNKSISGASNANAAAAESAGSSSTDSKFSGEFDVKNSQVAVICVFMVIAAVIIAGSNFFLVKSLEKSFIGAASSSRQNGTADATSDGAAAIAGLAAQVKSGKQMTIAMMPKSKGNAYFVACRKGAEEAAKELNVKLLWDGPTDPDPAKQNEVIDTWITRGVDVLAVAVENRDGISTVLRKARQKGIKVVTWDADAATDARDFLVNQATPEGIGYTLMDCAAEVMEGKGEFAIITASLTAANMIEWQGHIKARLAEKYPDIKLVDLRPCDDLQKKAYEEANTILNAHPKVKLIMGICSPAVPGAAEAVKQSGRKDVHVIGLSLPNDNKAYVHEGITKYVILWNTADLGYLAVRAAYALKEGTLKPGDKSIKAGRLGEISIKGDNILLGEPFKFTKENIDQFDF
jgi:rhamnose transport system substrate-binding protein